MLSTAVFSSEPTPKPTPRPGTLGAYATEVTLDRSALKDGDGRVVLTNDSVTALAADGKIILGAVSTDRHRQAKSSSVADNAERARWQAAHHKQRQVIAALERRRSSLALQRDQIENLGLTAKTMARLQQLEAKLLQLDRDIAGERARLARIVRDARRRGAEPGWFR
jgi:hypothetical protein